jgi:hypothetical protein
MFYIVLPRAFRANDITMNVVYGRMTIEAQNCSAERIVAVVPTGRGERDHDSGGDEEAQGYWVAGSRPGCVDHAHSTYMYCNKKLRFVHLCAKVTALTRMAGAFAAVQRITSLGNGNDLKRSRRSVQGPLRADRQPTLATNIGVYLADPLGSIGAVASVSPLRSPRMTGA